MPYALPLAYLAVFIAAIILVLVGATALYQRSDHTRRVARRLEALTPTDSPAEDTSSLLRRRAPGEFRSPMLARLNGYIQTWLEQADLAWTPSKFLTTIASVSAILCLASLAFVLARDTISPGVALATLAAAAVLPVLAAWAYLNRRRASRKKRIEEQLPIALDIVNRAIRAGHPIIAAVQLAADELDNPIGGELRKIVDETAYGSDFREALASFAKRTGSQDAHFFSVSVSIQAETGGSLAEILENLASVIRARATLAKRVKALGSEGRASANILSALPIMLIGGITLSEPHFYTDKFSDPVFWPAVISVCVVYLVGQLMMHRITHFKY